ncbi:MAG TPA: flavocytochrome c [Clostridiaceae bacterium]|jgi:urocanate reductase|nr:flavocytochrome c [Clostridiaceae bacterium]HBN29109.1 flavocytochrome c [Clostridiaceae bacterium]HCL51150.1 flavocytochrome c [Clostridiaceae bacterium]
MTKFKRIISMMLVAVLSIAMAGCGSKPKNGMKDGKYIGEGEGKGGKIKAEVTIDGGKIKDVKVVEQHETEGIWEEPAKEIIKNVIATNSANVDTVSGATLTSQGLIDAIKDALSKAGAQNNDTGAKVSVKEEDNEKPDQTYDVVVVGAGGAGLTAAIEAKNNGANVVVLEKMSSVGGNTIISGGEMAAAGNWIQKKEGIVDSPDKHFEDTMKGGDYKNDPKLVRKLVDNATPAAEWLRDEVGVEFEDTLFQFGAHSVKRSLVPKGASGVEIVKKLKAKADSLKIPIKLNMKATELIKEGNKVVGVKATSKSGKEITFHAKNGVILASGGFGSNVEMRKRFNPEYGEKYKSTNSVGATGDGITMAEKIGADLKDPQYIQAYPMCDPLSGRLLYADDTRSVGTLIVNKEGKRFVNELGRRDVVSQAILKQTGSVCYELWDQNIHDLSKIEKNHKAELDYLAKNKLYAKVNTVKEAADFFQIDAAELQKSLDTYNKYCENGKDEQFGKTKGSLVPINKPPYYIIKACPGIHHTMGGVKIDDESHVIAKDGSIIKGLYAAGEVTGGVHGTNRLGSNAIADITVFGRISGKNAALQK